MKTISLIEPWATLVAIGAKTIETRSWPTDYRGPIAIHASKKMTVADWEMCQEPDFEEALTRAGVSIYPFGGHCGPVKEAFKETRGKVIATARLIACCRMEVGPRGAIFVRRPRDDAFRPIPEKELPFGHYAEGRYAWILADVVRLPEPIPAKGALGLWEWDDSALNASETERWA
jgi:hypothetical protein